MKGKTALQVQHYAHLMILGMLVDRKRATGCRWKSDRAIALEIAQAREDRHSRKLCDQEMRKIYVK